jgi:hypothetical protein
MYHVKGDAETVVIKDENLRILNTSHLSLISYT